MFKKFIRKKIVAILCEISKEAETEASKCAENYVKTDNYQNNPYRGPAIGFLEGTNWLSNEVLKRLG